MSQSQDIVLAAMEMEVAVLKLQAALRGIPLGPVSEDLNEYLDQSLKISQVISETFSKTI